MHEPAAAAAPASPSLRLTSRRGLDLLRDPALSQGSAFSAPQRLAFGLEALLQPQVESLVLQVQRSWAAFCQLEGSLERYAFVEGLRRSNLVLFHRFLSDHLAALLPTLQPHQPGGGRPRRTARLDRWSGPGGYWQSLCAC